MLILLISFLTGILVSIDVGFLIIRLAQRFNLIANPGITQHKKHTRPTPFGGDKVIFLNTLAAGFSLIFYLDARK